MYCKINSALALYEPITLEEMKSIRLMNRIDTKYVLPFGQLAGLLNRLRPHYRVQEVEGERICLYHTVYLDTPDKAMYIAHQNGKTVREKIRVRTYVGSGLTFLEVKNKNNKGRTDKKRMAVQGLQKVLVGKKEGSFLQQYASYDRSHLSPNLENGFYRITLVNRDKTERLTIDTMIRFRNLLTGKYSLLDKIAVIELKRAGECFSPVAALLRELHVRPVGFSKYCIGTLLTDREIKYNRFKAKLRWIGKVTA